MLIVILVTLTETTAAILKVGDIVGTKVDTKRIAAGLRADMISSAVSPVFGSLTRSASPRTSGWSPSPASAVASSSRPAVAS